MSIKVVISNLAGEELYSSEVETLEDAGKYLDYQVPSMHFSKNPAFGKSEVDGVYQVEVVDLTPPDPEPVEEPKPTRKSSKGE